MDSSQIVWAGVIASGCASLGTASGEFGRFVGQATVPAPRRRPAKPGGRDYVSCHLFFLVDASFRVRHSFVRKRLSRRVGGSNRCADGGFFAVFYSSNGPSRAFCYWPRGRLENQTGQNLAVRAGDYLTQFSGGASGWRWFCWR